MATSIPITFFWQSRNNNEALTPSIVVVNAAGAVLTSGSMTHMYAGKYKYLYTATSNTYFFAKVTAEGRETVLEPINVNVLSDTSTPSGTTYCTAADVQAELQLSTEFSTSTVPTLATINKWITQAEDQIDRKTNSSFRSTSVSNEYHDIDTNYLDNSYTGIRIPLLHRNIRTIDTAEGDSLYVYSGNDAGSNLFLSAASRGSTWWIDYAKGELWLSPGTVNVNAKAVLISYRYGLTSVPGDIAEACTKLVAIRLLQNDDRGFNVSDTPDGKSMPYDPRISSMKARVNEILRDRAEFHAF